MSGLGYACVGSDDRERAKAFYDALLPLAGIVKMFDHPSGGGSMARAGRSASLCWVHSMGSLRAWATERWSRSASTRARR